MKLIILAAGKGERLRPYTEEVPKCMVPLHGKPILEYILDAAQGIVNDISIVRGYKAAKIDYPNIKYYQNDCYDSTNMVWSLFCAESELDDDVIISYSDIAYAPKILKNLAESDNDISVVIDKEWIKLWKLRMENPLDDVETLKIDESGYISELGKKPNSLDEVQGQFMGLIKIGKEILPRVIEFYKNLDTKTLYDNKTFPNMFMTSFIQALIDDGFTVSPVWTRGGWLEVDTVDDLNIYEKEMDNLLTINE